MTSAGLAGSADRGQDWPAAAAPRLGRDFRVLWAAQSVSLLGSSLLVIVLPWEAYSLTHSTSSTAFVSAAQIAPYPVLGLVSGVIADRLDRRRTMIVCDTARAVLSGAIGAAIALAALRLWMLLAGTVVIGTFTAVFDASYASLTPRVVHPHMLNQANGRLEASSAAASVIGPGGAGVLLAMTGTAAAFGLDAVSYVAGAFGSLLLCYRPVRLSPARPADAPSAARMAREGVRYLMRTPVLRLLTMAAAALAVANGALDGLLVPLLRGRLHYGELAVGRSSRPGPLDG